MGAFMKFIVKVKVIFKYWIPVLKRKIQVDNIFLLCSERKVSHSIYLKTKREKSVEF